MRIIDVTLRHFRRHKGLRVTFRAGINAIVGKNAVGKTTILEAIVFALTGSLFHGTKESAIQVGHESGGVELNFELNGKRGTITRHLEATKITLNYDGVVYKKATEVKEMWDKLLQVQPEFIENIITARQSRIDALFSDDDEAAKEKLFQKIFLVPATEKIRSAIYRNYMKQCPPLLSVEEPAQLHTIRNNKLREIEELTTAHKARTFVYSSEDEFDAKKRKKYLEACVRSETESGLIRQRKESAETKSKEVNDKIQELQELLGSLNIKDFYAELTAIEKQISDSRNKKKLLASLAKVNYATKEEAAQHLKLYEQYTCTHTEITERIREIEAQLELNSKLCRADPGAAHSCPVCEQDISHLHDLKAKAKAHSEELDAELIACYASKNDYQQKYQTHLDKHYLVAGHCNEKEKLLTELSAYTAPILTEEEIAASFEEIAQLETVVKNYEAYDKELKELLGQSVLLTKNLAQLEAQTANLSIYDEAQASIDLEMHMVDEFIVACETARLEESSFNVKLQVAQARVTELNERIAEAERNSERNAKRNRYMEVISRIYDGFHVSNFPRKLVQSYTNAVTERLQERLDALGLPFTARINERFETLIFDKENRRLPTASGGQKVLLGLSLHLALHDLFSQSFPLFMIDEGTTHLDGDNVNKYFEFIASLKTDKKLNQIIIIDHHEGLKEVVDHVIEL